MLKRLIFLAVLILVLELIAFAALQNKSKQTEALKTSEQDLYAGFPVSPSHPNVNQVTLTYTFRGIIEKLNKDSIKLKSENSIELPVLHYSQDIEVVRRSSTSSEATPAALQDLKVGEKVYITARYILQTKTWSTVRITLSTP